jgi:hypothetical protein
VAGKLIGHGWRAKRVTLCAVWKRKAGNTEELVFATDSRLTGGELWDSGIKLFGFPREDCLLCFCGETRRAYPLILHLVESIRYDKHLLNRHTDLQEVVEHITDLFTELCDELRDPPHGYTLDDLKSGVEFIFGGWCWKKQMLACWKITYSPEANGFIPQALHDDSLQPILFIGDHAQKAKQKMYEILGNSDNPCMDMEPLTVITRFALDTEQYPEIGGSLQIAKVYQSGTTEFIGVFWPSFTGGATHFLGRVCKTDVRYLNPESNLIDTIEGWKLAQQEEMLRKLNPDIEPETEEVYVEPS